MARRKRRKSTKRKSGCKIVTVCGKRRRLCWGKKGIKSNTAVGGSRKRKSTKRRSTKRRRTAAAKGGFKLVSKSQALRKSGKRKGTLKKGCKARGGKFYCRKAA